MKWKIKSLNLFTIVALIGIMSCLSACEKDSIVIEARTHCTSDLLDFVTPVVTIQGDNGEKEVFRLTEKDFNIRSTFTLNNTITINGVSTTVVITKENMIATSKKTFDDVKAIKGIITVKYERNSNAELKKDWYSFNNGLEYTSKISIDGKSTEGPKDSVMSKSENVAKDDVEKYITDLCDTETTIAFDIK